MLAKPKEKLKILFNQCISAIKHLKSLILTKDNKTPLYAISALIVLLLVGLVGYLLLNNFQKELFHKDIKIREISPQERRPREAPKEETTSQDSFYSKPEGELSDLIHKANILYDNGHIDQALEIFSKIALYSQSLAYYNLGVIRMKEGQHKEATELFQRSVDGGDDVALSALNAAYSSIKNKDTQGFERFIKIADRSLANSAGTPFYSYLYAMVSYYKNQYFEALSPLLHPNSSDYLSQSKAMTSQMFLMLGDDYNALEYLKQDKSPQNALALGMLYARNGHYAEAKAKIEKYSQANPKNLEAMTALELVNLKLRDYKGAASVLAELEKRKKKPYFSIRVGLNHDMFNTHFAQENFWSRKFESRKSLQYKILFYYAPYKVFDAKRVFQFFSEGGFEWGAGSIDEAKDSYTRGRTISRLDENIAMGLKEIYLGDLRRALKIFLKNAEEYSQHSVLFYNIGLLYAQLGDFESAHSYFLKAYYLDNQDILAGVFAIMTGRLTYQDISRLLGLVAEGFVDVQFRSPQERQFYYAIFQYVRNEGVGPLDLEEGKEYKPIYYALEAVDAMSASDEMRIRDSFDELKKRYPNDLATNIMYQVAKNYGGDLQEISLKFSNLFRKGSFSDLHSLHYGGSLCRELYIHLAFTTGNLTYVIAQLQEKLSSEEKDPVGTLQALGLAYIYNQEFEQAFAIYNTLIDNFKVQSPLTRFLGAVAAIGAGHHNNAVALLQISKLDSSSTLESRYALALLYQQVDNLKSAISLLQSIADKGFVSEFFDFTIDTSAILQKAQE